MIKKWKNLLKNNKELFYIQVMTKNIIITFNFQNYLIEKNIMNFCILELKSLLNLIITNFIYIKVGIKHF